MATMILAHPRSKSSLLADCFNDYIGEIFNIRSIDKNTLIFDHTLNGDHRLASEIWRDAWAQKYFQNLEKKLTLDKDVCFKVFFDHIAHFPQGLELIRKINPTVIAISRQNKLHAIKSLLIAEMRGFAKHYEKAFDPFTVTFYDFCMRYQQCVVEPKLLNQLFKPDWTTTYETFEPANFPYAQRLPELIYQNSAEVFSFILNEQVVEQWFELFSSPKPNDLKAFARDYIWQR